MALTSKEYCYVLKIIQYVTGTAWKATKVQSRAVNVVKSVKEGTGGLHGVSVVMDSSK